MNGKQIKYIQRERNKIQQMLHELPSQMHSVILEAVKEQRVLALKAMLKVATPTRELLDCAKQIAREMNDLTMLKELQSTGQQN